MKIVGPGPEHPIAGPGPEHPIPDPTEWFQRGTPTGHAAEQLLMYRLLAMSLICFVCVVMYLLGKADGKADAQHIAPAGQHTSAPIK